MDISTLKNRISSSLPIYLGDIEVKVVEIFDIFNLIEIDLKEGNKNRVVDVMVLNEIPHKENTIQIDLFINKGGRRC